MISHYAEQTPYQTKDGSTIRELMHPAVQGNVAQSLAEACVAPGASTRLHQHTQTEELYHILEGEGRMTLGDKQFVVKPGDTICIPPGTAHQIHNTAQKTLRFLCACTPAYSHADTVMLE